MCCRSCHTPLKCGRLFCLLSLTRSSSGGRGSHDASLSPSLPHTSWSWQHSLGCQFFFTIQGFFFPNPNKFNLSRILLFKALKPTSFFHIHIVMNFFFFFLRKEKRERGMQEIRTGLMWVELACGEPAPSLEELHPVCSGQSKYWWVPTHKRYKQQR